MDSLTELFCLIDDFCRLFERVWIISNSAPTKHLSMKNTKKL